ncbi:MAG: glycosyltransferase family 4 protein [Deltaproteobacteria bacterium]|nr:glycosyltransferase family 4 protein [Deltaproteobacteria bacterium]
MHVVINALSSRQGGGQTYLRNLLGFRPPAGTRVSVIATPALRLPSLGAGVRRLDMPGPCALPAIRLAWERWRLPALLRELDADVLFAPGGTLVTPVRPGCATVTMFRNMVPFDPVQRARYPLGYGRARNAVLEHVLLDSMLSADLVIFVSEFARQVIERRAGGRLRRSVVIPHGVGRAFRARPEAEPRPAWVGNGDYVLYVSTLEMYKAQVEVVRAFARLRTLRPTPERLVLVGAEYPPYGARVREEIRRAGVGDVVAVRGEVVHDSLPAAYRHAKLVLFASECENCPNILLEAMAAGRPLLCSDRPPMPEFGGDAVEYFDPCSPEDLAARMAELLDRPDRRAELGRLAEERSRRYDWADTVSRTWQAIQALHDGVATSAGGQGTTP